MIPRILLGERSTDGDSGCDCELGESDGAFLKLEPMAPRRGDGSETGRPKERWRPRPQPPGEAAEA